MKGIQRRLYLLGSLPIFLGFGILTHSITELFGESDSSTLEEIVQREYLRCGITGTVEFMSMGNRNAVTNSVIKDYSEYAKDIEAGYYETAKGFETDYCRAIALAIFGELEIKNSKRSRVLFLNTSSKAGSVNERFKVLKSKEVDVLIRQTTWNGFRDTSSDYSVEFGPTIFHDGQKLLAFTDSGIESTKDILTKEKKVCVASGTTTEKNLLKGLLEAGGFKDDAKNRKMIKEKYLVTGDADTEFPDSTAALKEFLSPLRRRCEVVTGDESALLSNAGAAAGISEADNTSHFELSDFKLFPEKPLSYEPLAPVYRNDDPVWGDIIRFAVLITFWAEENGYSMKLVKNTPPPVLPTKIWVNLGLPENRSNVIIGELGNYGEIFSRNFDALLTNSLDGGSSFMVRGQNRLHSDNPPGLIISPPLHDYD